MDRRATSARREGAEDSPVGLLRHRAEQRAQWQIYAPSPPPGDPEPNRYVELERDICLERDIRDGEIVLGMRRSILNDFEPVPEQLLVDVLDALLVRYVLARGPEWNLEVQDIDKPLSIQVRVFLANRFGVSVARPSPKRSAGRGSIGYEEDAQERRTHSERARLIAECRHWLFKHHESGPKNRPKAKYRDEAMQQIPGLSARGFNRAWDEVVGTDPQWIGSGRPRKRRTD